LLFPFFFGLVVTTKLPDDSLEDILAEFAKALESFGGDLCGGPNTNKGG